MQTQLPGAAHLLHSKAEVFAIKQFSDTETSSGTSENQKRVLKATRTEVHLGAASLHHTQAALSHPSEPGKDRTNKIREITSLSDY